MVVEAKRALGLLFLFCAVVLGCGDNEVGFGF